MYQERFYRENIKSRFQLEVCFRESDLHIATDKKIDKNAVWEILKKYYCQIEDYARGNTLFINSLSPIAHDETAPFIVKEMIRIAHITRTGPFASVAGAVAYCVGQELLRCADEVIVENGGDIFLKIKEEKILGLYLGEKYSLDFLRVKLVPRAVPFGIAASSATMGPSLNFGKADLVAVIADDALLADGFATAFSNQILKEADAHTIIAEVKEISSVQGIIIAIDKKLFVWGNVELAS